MVCHTYLLLRQDYNLFDPSSSSLSPIVTDTFYQKGKRIDFTWKLDRPQNEGKAHSIFFLTKCHINMHRVQIFIYLFLFWLIKIYILDANVWFRKSGYISHLLSIWKNYTTLIYKFLWHPIIMFRSIETTHILVMSYCLIYQNIKLNEYWDHFANIQWFKT